MTFQLTAITAQRQWRDFCFPGDDLEETYQLLQTIVRNGDTIISVTLRDNQGCLPLPLDVLEEPAFSNPIQALRQQWEEQLAQPVGSSIAKSQSSPQNLKLQERVLELANCLLCFENTRVSSRQTFENLLQLQDDPQIRSAIMERYTVLVERQWRSTNKMKTLHQRAVQKLGILKSKLGELRSGLFSCDRLLTVSLFYRGAG